MMESVPVAADSINDAISAEHFGSPDSDWAGFIADGKLKTH